jgi:hypothetical protein
MRVTCFPYRQYDARNEGRFGRNSGLNQEKIFGGENSRFYWGFCEFLVFCAGENVVSLWWNAW